MATEWKEVEIMNKMSLQKSIQNFGIKQALKYMEKDPEENIPKLMDGWQICTGRMVWGTEKYDP